MKSSESREPERSEPSSTECRFTAAGMPHCFEHSDGRCCGCDLLDPDAEAPKRCTCGPDEACGDPCVPEPSSGEFLTLKDGEDLMEALDRDAKARERGLLPPMTPEEEEEAPEDAEHVCVHPEGYEGKCPCPPSYICCKVQPAPPPPQPERRPPYVVAYSVQGHLYEVALPGDATVRAVDGALVIQHHLGPIAGIVQVLPVLNERSADGAEADQ